MYCAQVADFIKNYNLNWLIRSNNINDINHIDNKCLQWTKSNCIDCVASVNSKLCRLCKSYNESAKQKNHTIT